MTTAINTSHICTMEGYSTTKDKVLCLATLEIRVNNEKRSRQPSGGVSKGRKLVFVHTLKRRSTVH